MNLAFIQQLANEEEALHERVRTWYLDFVHPRVILCSSLSELDDIWLEISQACNGNDGTPRGLPGLLTVEKHFSYSSIRNKLK